MTAPRYVLEDPPLPHQVYLYFIGSGIAVSCNCMRGIDGSKRHRSPLEVRGKWETGEAYACWLGHMAAIGAEVA